ncbi:hypothetical protein CAMGR0001_0008 [Campylobacter gracilis RM3268]|uniref:Uncharacterized protein n=1 Tax=Campylobacter gracilis RM3268 TaxID=553220 RepID=C8PI27_9BACT|nr:hypothetical protein CAMGR0001_0008 [Campylobacter gracilis RM3268]
MLCVAACDASKAVLRARIKQRGRGASKFSLAQNPRRRSYRRVKFRSMFRAKRKKTVPQIIRATEVCPRGSAPPYLLERFKNVFALKFNAYR